MNRKILEKQGLVLGVFLFTWLGMKIRDVQYKVAMDKQIKDIKSEEFNDQIIERLEILTK